jgi:hypothetical protein
MKWFLIIMGAIFLLLFCAICVVDKIIVKEKKDSQFHEKMERIRGKWQRTEPIIKFTTNLFWWVFAALVVYYIYLG